MCAHESNCHHCTNSLHFGPTNDIESTTWFFSLVLLCSSNVSNYCCLFLSSSLLFQVSELSNVCVYYRICINFIAVNSRSKFSPILTTIATQNLFKTNNMKIAVKTRLWRSFFFLSWFTWYTRNAQSRHNIKMSLIFFPFLLLLYLCCSVAISVYNGKFQQKQRKNGKRERKMGMLLFCHATHLDFL